MLLPCYAPLSLSERVESWQHGIEGHTQTSHQTSSEENCRSELGHGMKLRSRPLYTKSDPSIRRQTPRLALAQITVPNRSARRKAPDHTYPTKKRRHIMDTGHTSGRALRSGKTKATNTAGEDFVLQSGEQSKQAFQGSRSPVRRSARQPPAGAIFSQMSLVQLNDLSSLDSEATSSKSRKESPEKTPSTPRRRGKGLDQGLKGDQLGLAILASCSPPVPLCSIEKVRQLGYEIPSRVMELHRLLKNVPPANIPLSLQVSSCVAFVVYSIRHR